MLLINSALFWGKTHSFDRYIAAFLVEIIVARVKSPNVNCRDKTSFVSLRFTCKFTSADTNVPRVSVSGELYSRLRIEDSTYVKR